ncbi:hypothetical protein N7G274_008330 [Stereocaulon virgatum]|uniref:Uncharacterized protein n=1 Tax=Stereocaulon virgatum TaxID=373712 RepID=A0ABR3ZZD8_9LECA
MGNREDGTGEAHDIAGIANLRSNSCLGVEFKYEYLESDYRRKIDLDCLPEYTLRKLLANNDFSDVILGLDDLGPMSNYVKSWSADGTVGTTDSGNPLDSALSKSEDDVSCVKSEEGQNGFKAGNLPQFQGSYLDTNEGSTFSPKPNGAPESVLQEAEEDQQNQGRRHQTILQQHQRVRQQQKSVKQAPIATTKLIKKVHLPINVHGSTYATSPDSGSRENIMAKSVSDQLNLTIDDTAEHQKEFRMANGKIVKALGRASVDCSFVKEPHSQQQCWFYVLQTLITPIIMGMAFLNATKTLTKYRHRLQSSMVPRTGPLQLYAVNNPVQRIRCHADSKAVLANADTGSEVDLISLAYAKRRGFNVKKVELGDNRIQFADGSEAYLAGKVSISILLRGKTGRAMFCGDSHREFQRTFYVLEGLTSDMILGEEILDDTNAFETYNTALALEKSGDTLSHLDTIVWLRTPERLVRNLLAGNGTAAPEPLSGESLDDQAEARPGGLIEAAKTRIDQWLHRQRQLADAEIGANSSDESRTSFEARMDARDARELHRREVANANIAALPEGLKSAEMLVEAEKVADYEVDKLRLLQARAPARQGTVDGRLAGSPAQVTSTNSPVAVGPSSP